MRSYTLSLAAWLCLLSRVGAEHVVISEVMYNPPAGKPEYVEVRNLTSNRFDFANWRLTGGVEFTSPDFNPGSPDAHFLREYERIVISSAPEAATRAAYPSIPVAVRVYGPWTGQLDNGGDNLRLEDAAGVRQCAFSYSDSGKWPVAADGAGHSLVVINENRNSDDWRNWKASRLTGGSPGLPEVLEAEEPVAGADYAITASRTLFDYNQVWRWKAADVDPAPAAIWAGRTFDDSTWSSGKGILGFKPATALTQFVRLPDMDSDGLTGQGGPDATEGLRTLLPRFINGTTAPQYMVYLFRTSFNYSGPLTTVGYAIDQCLDDGALYYLNGVRLGGGQRLADVGTALINLARVTTPASSATQTSTSGSQTAALGIDALNTNFTQTLNTDLAPAWTVNLNRTAAISTVSIHNRESGFRERLRDITITILEGTTVLHTSPLLNPLNALGSPTDIVYDVVAANGGNPLLARSVRISRTPDATGGTGADDASVLSVAEVQVLGREAWNRAATTAVSNPVEELSNISNLQGTIPADPINGGILLKAGLNVLAAEVHQNSAGDTDLGFAARMRVTKTAGTASVVINEVKPGSAPGQGFVEFYNTTAVPVDLLGYYLSDNESNLTRYQIASSVIVPATGLATVDFAGSGLAPASPMTIILTQPDGLTPQTAFRSANLPFDGRSIGRKPEGGLSWRLFAQPTPGTGNSGGSLTGTPLLLSEAHFAAATGRVDWVEFTNPTGSAASGTGLFVASRTDWTDKVPMPASVPANGFASASVDFAVGGSGDVTLYLIDSQNNVLGTAELTHRAGLGSVQRQPPGSSEWYNAPADTRDAANNPVVHGEIVINEVMFSPPSSHEEGQYVELYNRSAGPVNLTGWRFVDGLNYDFPAGTVLAAGQYLVVAKNPTSMTASYGALPNLHGPFDGRLRGGGELIRLEDERGNLADSVDYKSGGQWPKESGGEGSSMELLHPDMDNSEPSSWRASNESNKTAFQSYTHTGTYKQLRGTPNAGLGGTATTADYGYKELLLNLVSDGHVVLRNISLTRAAAPGTNLIVTGDATSHNGLGTVAGGVYTSPPTGFLCTGTHCMSDTLADGFHLISVGSGDTKANKAEVDVRGILPNDVLTLSFEARWVSGMPLMVAQTWDRSFGKVFRFPIPNNLGTPGAANSRAAAAPPPTVDAIRHSPAVPTSTQPVVVSARVKSANPLTAVSLRERLDTVAGNGAWNTIAMNDSGTGGDVTAGDGVWSATVPPRADPAITQFYVRATADNGQSNECPRDGEGVAGVNGSVLRVPGRPAMWIADNSPPSSQPGTLVERYVFSLYHRNAMNTATGFSATYDWDFPRMSNFGLNATMILNESDVIYNCELRKGGSPWTRNGGPSMERARWRTPGDTNFRNRTRFAIDSDGSITNTPARFHNRISRYMLYLFGYPVPEAEFVQQIVNGDAPGWRDNMELTDSEFFDRAYGDGGELYEIDDAWYMYDVNNMDDRLDAGSVTGRWFLTDWTNAAAGANPSDESPIYFHGNWPIRFPEAPYDYGALSSFIKIAYNNNAGVTAATDAVFREKTLRSIDLDSAGIYAAVRGYIGDWDNFTLNRGKNGYFFRRPADGKFEFHHWDSDLAFQSATEAWIGSTGGIGWTNFSNRPWFRQRFNVYLHQLINKYTLNSARMDAWLRNMNYQATNSNPLAPFKTQLFSYPAWFRNRMAGGLNFIGAANYSRAFTITTANNQTVATPLFNMAGEGPSTVSVVDIVNHGEAVLSWAPAALTPAGVWNLSGIALAAGVNNLTVRALDLDGAIIGTLPFTVTLSVAAPPVAKMAADPKSLNLTANELIVLDGTGSFDPDGGALTYAWSITPTAGAIIAHSEPGKTEARFTIPGIYTASLTVTDPALSSSTVTREIVVANANDFAPFADGDPLGPQFTVENMEVRDNFSPSSWYSVEDNSGRLEISVLDDVAKPLSNPGYTHPLITRDLPDSSDFSLQTDMMPATREFGNFSAGLWLETTESGTATKYTFGVAGGTALNVYQAIGGAAWTQLSTVAFTGDDATLRIVRVGAALTFQRRVSDVWSTVHTLTMPAPSTAGRGGVFVATSQATTARMSFDYLLVTDPTNTNNVLANLRITEIMYNPAGAGGIEFIELTNIGTQPIDLAGVFFEEGRPFAQFTFPAYILNPGAFVVVTDATPAAFSAQYPATPPGSIFQWAAGSLNNAGERITLRDPFSNIIQDFSWNDDSTEGWPATPDGGGPSLEAHSTSGDYNSSSNWTASAETGGSPGRLGAAPDADRDGYPDRMEQIAGTSPASGGSFFYVTGQSVPGGQKLTWPSYPGRTYHVESSPALQPGSWTRRATISHPTAVPAGAAEFTVGNPSQLNTRRQYYRIVVELTP